MEGIRAMEQAELGASLAMVEELFFDSGGHTETEASNQSVAQLAPPPMVYPAPVAAANLAFDGPEVRALATTSWSSSSTASTDSVNNSDSDDEWQESFVTETHTELKKGSAPNKEATEVLKVWFFQHIEKPYPSAADKRGLCERTGMSHTQIKNWFTNMRKRHWSPVRQGREARSYVDFIIEHRATNA